MTTFEFSLDKIPHEMRKGEDTRKFFRAVSKWINWYIADIIRNGNYTILDELSGDRLEAYGERFGAIRETSWSDGDLIKRTKLLWYIYDKDLTILDNLSFQFSEATGYFSQVQFSQTEVSGEIDCVLVIPPGENQGIFNDIDNFWVYGCKIYPTFVDEANYSLYDSFGELGIEKYNTGLDPLTYSFKEI